MSVTQSNKKVVRKDDNGIDPRHVLKAKQHCSRLNSYELKSLSGWASKRANELFQREQEAVMRQYSVGERVVLGATSYSEFSGAVVTVSSKGTKRLHVRNDSGAILTIPYTSYYLVKGKESSQAVDDAKTEIEVNESMKEMLGSLFQGGQ